MGEGDDEPRFAPLVFHELPEDEMRERATAFLDLMDARRTTRHSPAHAHKTHENKSFWIISPGPIFTSCELETNDIDIS